MEWRRWSRRWQQAWVRSGLAGHWARSWAGRWAGWLVLLAGIYGLVRLLPYAALFDDGWAVWWPTNGITLAVLLMTRRRAWPWVLSAVALGTALNEVGYDPPGEILTVALCNLLEMLLPALMLPRFVALNVWLQQPRLVWKFVLYAVVLGPTLSSLLCNAYFHFVDHRPYWEIVFRWGLSDVVGIILFAPLVLVLMSRETYALLHRQRLFSTLSNLGLLVLAGWFVFDTATYPLGFVISPIALLIAMRMGFSGSVLAINLLAPIATAATLHGTGPFAAYVGPHRFLGVAMVQVFLVLTMLMAFPISVVRVQQQATTRQLEEAYTRMEMLATADGLTGLANRRRFDMAMGAEWMRGMRTHQPLACLMMDVDNFKAYNDSYGHPAGDLCLQAIASALQAIPERSSDLVARYGGEEFVMLLPNTSASGAMTLAEVVRARVERLTIPHRGNAAGVATISIGCAVMVPEERAAPGALIDASDQALYAAKQGGRNRVRLSEKGAGPSMPPTLLPVVLPGQPAPQPPVRLTRSG